MPGMDVFDGNAFRMQSLTASLLDEPHLPMRLQELEIFDARGVRTTDISVERKDNTLVLVQTTPRGGPAVQSNREGRNVRKLSTSRIALEDTINADEVQNVRSFGSESELQTLEAEVNDRNLRLSNSISATEEFHRIGAIKGLVLDADGSTLLNLFSEFEVTAQSSINWDLDNASPVSGALRKQCSAVIRLIEDELGALPYSSIHAMCSSQFFDDLTAHPEYRANKLNFEDARQLSERVARRRVEFGGITFEEYRGKVGATKYVADNAVHVIPIGVPDLFLTRYAPAEYWDTVNTMGLPRYARMNPDGNDGDHSRTLRVQSQVIHLCTRPRVLIPGTRT